jgi:hypothetical protein
MLIYLPENFASAHWLRDPGTLPSANLSLDSLRKPKNDGGWEKLWAS